MTQLDATPEAIMAEMKLILDQEAFQSIRTVEEAVEAIHKAAVQG